MRERATTGPIKPSVSLFCITAQALVPITSHTQNLPGYVT